MKKIVLIGVIAVVAIASIIGGMQISKAMERKAVNQAMQGYFDNYKSSFGEVYNGKYREDLDKVYRDNVKEIGKRTLTKIDRKTYEVKSRKKAPNFDACTLKVQQQIVSLYLPFAFGDNKPSDKEIEAKFINLLRVEMGKSENMEEFEIKVKIEKQNDGKWKAVESNGVKL